MKPLITAILIALTAGTALAKDLVSADVLADVTAIAPGKPFTVGVRLKIEPGWHVYWINPGDTGIATKLTFTLPPGYSAGEVQFPVPHRFEVAGGLMAFGYEDEVMLLATITPPANALLGSDVPIRVHASWLVCDKDQCVKGDATKELKLSVAAKSEPANMQPFATWQEQIPKPMPGVQQDVKIDAPAGQFKSAAGTIRVTWDKPPQKVEWFPATPDQLTIAPPQIKTDANTTVITFKAEALAGEKSVDASFPSVIAYTIDGKRIGALVTVSLVVPGSESP